MKRGQTTGGRLNLVSETPTVNTDGVTNLMKQSVYQSLRQAAGLLGPAAKRGVNPYFNAANPQTSPKV